MEAERANFPIGMMARLLGASRSGFYGWLARGRGDPWAGAREAVRACWEASRGRFGARTVRMRLAAQGTRLTLYRVRKIMRGLGIRGVVRNARKTTTVPDPGAPARPDLVRRRFRPPVPTTVLAVNVNLSFATFANANSPIAPTHFHRSRQRQAPLPASLSGARSLVR
ncbi:IS3 family transposase [Collinsella tanakaei]|nr:IS3 family transposase [Collinsella tanakaei]